MQSGQRNAGACKSSLEEEEEEEEAEADRGMEAGEGRGREGGESVVSI